MEVKNRFNLGESVKMISPTTQFEFTVDKILDPKGEEKGSAHGGSFHVWINVPENPGEWALLRRKAGEK